MKASTKNIVILGTIFMALMVAACTRLDNDGGMAQQIVNKINSHNYVYTAEERAYIKDLGTRPANELTANEKNIVSYYGKNGVPFTSLCTTNAGACNGRAVVTKDGINFNINNSKATNITLDAKNTTLMNVNCTQITFCTDDNCTDRKLVVAGQNITIRIGGCNFTKGTNIRTYISFDYENPQTSIPKPLQADVAGIVE